MKIMIELKITKKKTKEVMKRKWINEKKKDLMKR